MPSIQRVLIAYDAFSRNEPLSKEALEFARRYGAEVRVLNVLNVAGWRSLPSVGMTEHLETPRLIAERRQQLQALVDAAGATDLVESVVIREGTPHVEIIREAMEWQADLVCVTDEPIHRGEEYGFGAVTMKLFRKCPVPVLALRHDHLLADSHVVAAVDLSDEELALNAKVVGWARAIAGVTADVAVAYAWEVWGEDLLRSRAPGGEVDVAVAKAQEHARARLAQVLAELGDEGQGVTAIVEHGAGRVAIPRLVAREGFDVVVMGTLSRTGLKGLLIGNTAERILNRLAASVLAIKPDGFVSPVEPRAAPAPRS